MTRLMNSTSPYSTTGYDASFKEFYDGMMESLVPTLFPIVDWFKDNGRIRRVKPKGKYISFATEMEMSSAFGLRGENDYVPPADNVTTVQGQVHYARGIKGRIGVSFESMKFGKDGVGAFVDLVKQEMKGALVSMKQIAAPAIWGAGDGVLAKVNGAVSAATTVTVDSVEKYNILAPGTRWLSPGMKVISCDADSSYATDMAAAIKVASITSDTVFELASNGTITDDYHIVGHHCTDKTSSVEKAKGSVTLGTANSYRGPIGLSAMVDDASLYTPAAGYMNISESSYPLWKGVTSDNAGTLRSISTDLMYQLFFKMTRAIGDWDPNLVSWMNSDMYREIVKLMEPFVEFKARDLKPGFKEFNMLINGINIPIRLDHYCPGYIFFLNPDKITFAQGCAPEVGRETGAIWNRVADKDNFEAFWRWIFQLYTKKRNAHGVLRDLSYTVTSV